MSSMLGAGAMSNHVPAPRRFLDVATSSSSEDTWFCRPPQDGKVQLHGKLMEVDCGNCDLNFLDFWAVKVILPDKNVIVL